MGRRLMANISCCSKRWVYRFLLVHCLVVAAANAQHAHTPSHRAATSSRMRVLLDPLIEKAVADGAIPGAVLLVGHNGRVVYRQAFGYRSLEPVREPMSVDTIFDLASLTKCVAT